MPDFEKLGSFYLGRAYDVARREPTADLILYDAKDLVTHAVCVGMTGSGKTGLCVTLLEEAAIDGIPAIVIDPKGDLGNLLLTFPRMRAEDFQPWVSAEDAAKAGLSIEAFAADQAALWKKGLEAWGQDTGRVQRFADAAEVAIYTPGSNAGLPVSILRSFARPDAASLEDAEGLRERIGTTVTSLLGLVGIAADPIQSREHVLLSSILETAWRGGQDLDLPSLIGAVQSPSMTKIGVLDVDAFFPPKDRFALAMALNNLVASPGFATWTEGEPLNVPALLRTPDGKPRISIFSIAHLDDAQRMFFVSLLLQQVVGWMRGQSGTTSLRALLYMDEIFGYFPPVQNPPSKAPLLTLLKQARAFGLGVVLATQNPVDLDYKGLANAGTWFVGRLQTERDKARLLDGLEGAATTSGSTFDRAEMDKLISGLGSRVFLMSNAHEQEPVVFHTRWALSYLRGPLTRTQIKTLMAGRRPQPATAAAIDNARSNVAGAPTDTPPTGAVSPAGTVSTAGTASPALGPGITQYFVPARGLAPAGKRTVYRAAAFGAATVLFRETKASVDAAIEAAHLAPITDQAIPVDWTASQEAPLAAAELERAAIPGGTFADSPRAAGIAANYEKWAKDYAAWLYGNCTLTLLQSPSTKVLSLPGELERDFRARLAHATHERRDAAAEKLRAKYAPKIAALQDRLRRAEQAVEKERADARGQQMQTVISVGATILGAFVGRKAINYSTLGRATTAARGAGRILKQQQDVDRATESASAVQAQLAALEAEFEEEMAALDGGADAETLARVAFKPKKANIKVQIVALAWLPYWVDDAGEATPAWT